MLSVVPASRLAAQADVPAASGQIQESAGGTAAGVPPVIRDSESQPPTAGGNAGAASNAAENLGNRAQQLGSGLGIPPLLGSGGSYSDGGGQVGTAESTILDAAGDLRRGTGELRRGTGEAALYGSIAEINIQKAVEEYLENQVERVKAYREMRKQWEQTRNDLRREPLAPEQYRAIAERRSPDRLATESFNPETGQILWPPPLDAQQLQVHRQAIEQHLARRASSGYKWSVADYHQVNRHVQVMVRAVRAVEELLSPNEFAGLLQMLESIEWEAQHDASGKRLALLGGGAVSAQKAQQQSAGQAAPSAGGAQSSPTQQPSDAAAGAGANEPIIPEPPQPVGDAPR